MENGYYVLLQNDDGLILTYVESWSSLINLLDTFEGNKMYVTLSLSDFTDKLIEWRSRQCQDQNIVIEN